MSIPLVAVGRSVGPAPRATARRHSHQRRTYEQGHSHDAREGRRTPRANDRENRRHNQNHQRRVQPNAWAHPADLLRKPGLERVVG